MNAERQAFLAALAANEDDTATRLVYADWLDEHDEPEEADRMRAWPAAKEWVSNYAGEIGISYGELMGYAEEAIKDGYTSIFDGERYDGWSFDNEQFWPHYATLTGHKIDDNTPIIGFSCSC